MMIDLTIHRYDDGEICVFLHRRGQGVRVLVGADELVLSRSIASVAISEFGMAQDDAVEFAWGAFAEPAVEIGDNGHDVPLGGAASDAREPADAMPDGDVGETG